MKKLLPLALVGLFTACDLHQHYGPDQRYGLEAGMTEEEILELMGEPFDREENAEGREVWVFKGKMGEGQFNQPRDPYEIRVTMVDGRATSVIHDNEKPGKRARKL